MAETGYTPIQLYHSTTGAATPTAGNLLPGELAINTNDGKLFYEDSGGVVQVIATKGGANGDVVGPASATDNAIVRFDLTTGKLVQNSGVTVDDSNNLTLPAQADLRFADSDSSNWVAFQGAATIASNVTWTLPSAEGTANHVFTTDGSGTISWSAVSLTAGVTGQLPLANGGTGANLTDPNADRILFWDDSAGAVTWLEAGSGLSISGTTITSTGGTVTSVGGTGTVAGITLTGTVTTSGNLTLGGTLSVDLTTMVTGDLPYSNLAQGSALSVLGVTGNATADVASIAAGTDHQVLRRSGTSLAFGAVNLDQAAAITGTLPVGNGGTGITSLGTGVATWLGTPSSANLASAVTDETGSGALVFATAPSLSGAVFNDGYTEEVYAIPSSTTPALSPTNGSIQTWTLTGASTPTAGTWAAGQSMTLMIDDGTAYTITWTSVLAAGNWIGGSAPTLATSGYTVIELWKVGSTIYGALVGNLT